MKASSILLFCCIMLSNFILSSTKTDTIAANESIRDGETIVSAGGVFELGFFSPGTFKNRYVGIWYKVSNTTVVWVANREAPVFGSSSFLTVNNEGILALLNNKSSTVWSSNASRPAKSPVVAQLLDSGNLVLRDGSDENPENFLWQSFDHPQDTELPGMKIGWNLRTGREWYLSSWKSSDDPAEGQYTMKLDPNGYPQFFLRKGSNIEFRSGPWNGLRFSGRPNLKPNPVYSFTFVDDNEEMYFSFEPFDSSVLIRTVVNQDGIMQRYLWNDGKRDWILYLTAQTDRCDTFGYCGVHGSCNIGNSPVCGCLKGFEPKFPRDWEMADWSKGCVRRTSLDCRKGDGFVKYSGIKVPDTRWSSFNRSMTLEECKMICLKNCNCTAYASLDIRKGGSGCLLWYGDLMDIREYTENGQDIYIRMAASEVGQVGSNEQKRVRVVVISAFFSGMLLLGLVATLYVWKRKKKTLLNREVNKGKNNAERGHTTENQKEDLELPLFDIATIANATDNFSTDNKLGEGGFGPVYKGVVQGGQEIAVKRLSQNSRQGLDEFKNEVLCIAKLQHRNLVKLLGCCIEEENILIYEYMPNKSLDFFIFDKTKSTSLNWGKRYHIIHGIARGLLYLHQDSRLRIIHRDLKASNVLLDFDMNPKISDFGMARSFGGSETQANTTRVVGTYGYMSPEYAIDGLFSVKSDVFSFGVLVLEIVSGNKNRGFHHREHNLNLLGHAWTLHKEGRSLELIDTSVSKSCNLAEVLRSIHIGLLCVQQRPEDRPSMANVVVMLGSENALPQPKHPGFFNERNLLEEDSSSSKQDSCSANEITVTLLSAR